MMSIQKQVKVAGLLALSIALFVLAFTIDRVDGKVFEHSNVLKLDAKNFDEKVSTLTTQQHLHHKAYPLQSKASYSSLRCVHLVRRGTSQFSLPSPILWNLLDYLRPMNCGHTLVPIKCAMIYAARLQCDAPSQCAGE